MATLSSGRELAAGNIQQAKNRYKEQYDCGIKSHNFRVGEWVFVRFPQNETADECTSFLAHGMVHTNDVIPILLPGVCIHD